MPYAKQAQSLGEMLRLACAARGEETACMVPSKQGFVRTSYREYWERVRSFAAALQALGVQRGDRVVLFSENCVEWAWCDWALQTLGAVTVPIYPTLPPDQAQYIVSDAGARLVLAGSDDLAGRVAGMDGVRIEPLRGKGSLAERADSATLDESAWIAAMGEIHREDLATIIYTSGTTGNPKGAMLPHRAFLHLVDAIRANLPVDENDIFLSFLPLSHVYERMAGHIFPIGIGATIAYSQSLATLSKDIETVRPTIMLCVPRFLEAIRGRVIDAVEKQGGLKLKLFRWALAQGVKRARGEFAPFSGILDALVGKKIRERLGGRMRFLVSGGAALPPPIAEFYMAFRIHVLQGYGLTETCGANAVNHPDDNRYETVGRPIPGVEMKLGPDGEILISGPAVMLGYFNLPDATREAIDADGWFHTGDIGAFEGQNLRITDRKKDLIVLANGKNVAPQVIENKVRESVYIAEAVLFGDAMEYCCALIVPDFDKVKAFCKEKGLPHDSNEAMTAHEEVKALIKGEIDAINKTLADYEKVKRHTLLNHSFSIESGELTPSMKVKRKVVLQRYADLIKGMQRG
ncbi:MAG TPA: long-chain fatty acid--CoA ligase [Fimbriimonadaceae bacterium]|nr:long-chain fatty acid--CoA ligase [Fimbriimonadaceae bacterium]